jgi:hypothetical protein
MVEWRQIDLLEISISLGPPSSTPSLHHCWYRSLLIPIPIPTEKHRQKIQPWLQFLEDFFRGFCTIIISFELIIIIIYSYSFYYIPWFKKSFTSCCCLLFVMGWLCIIIIIILLFVVCGDRSWHLFILFIAVVCFCLWFCGWSPTHLYDYYYYYYLSLQLETAEARRCERIARALHALAAASTPPLSLAALDHALAAAYALDPPPNLPTLLRAKRLRCDKHDKSRAWISNLYNSSSQDFSVGDYYDLSVSGCRGRMSSLHLQVRRETETILKK